MKKNINKYLVISLVIPFLGQLGCGKREGGGGVDGGSTNIQNKGSDTMLQLAQAWSEMYLSAAHPASKNRYDAGAVFSHWTP